MGPRRRRIDVLADSTMRTCLSGLLGSALLFAMVLAVWGSAGWPRLKPAPAVLLSVFAVAAGVSLLFALRRLAVVRRLVRGGVLVRAEVLVYDPRGRVYGRLRVAYRHEDRDFQRAISMEHGEGRLLAEAGEVYLLIDPADPELFAMAMPDEREGQK